jgi:hypothetical protein
MTDPPDPLIGRVLQQTWRIEAFVARGSMGAVYRGQNTRCGTPVAVKVLNPEYLHDAEIRERFRREAMVSSRCDSPHLVRVLDLVEPGDGLVCLVMEWLHGESLADRLARRGRLPLGETARLMAEIGEGLHEAHEMGIVHRDLKPGNIYLAEAGRVGLQIPKIVDFGISKIIEAGTALTATATMMGTPHYMPVEQFDDSKVVDSRADIYALGVITYELLAGRRPFRGRTPMAILQQVAAADPAPLPAEIPGAVAAVVRRAMSRQATDRYPTVLDFTEALTEAATAAGHPPPPPKPAAELGLEPPASQRRWRRWLRPLSRRWRPLERRLGPHRARWVALGALGALLALVTAAAGGLFLALRESPAETDADTSAAAGVGGPGKATPRPTLGILARRLSPPGVATRGLALDAAGQRAVTLDAAGRLHVFRLDGAPRRRGAARRAAAERSPAATPIRSSAADAGAHSPPGAGESFTAVALSPDGRWIALGRADGRVALRRPGATAGQRAAPGQRLLAHRHGGAVTALGFSADANRLLSGDQGGEVWVWDVREGRRLATLGDAPAAVTAVALRGDGRQGVVGRADGALVIWDVVTARRVARLTGHSQAVRAVAMHASGRLIVSASADGTARLWRRDSAAGADAGAAPGGAPRAASGPALPLSPPPARGRSWRPGAVLRGHQGAVLAVALSEDGQRVLTGGSDGTARLWSRGGAARARLRLPGAVSRVALAAGGTLRAVSGPQLEVRIYRRRPRRRRP